ncbi:MAG: hypothetical protein KDC86_13145 [Saprospiraceae bacterium]|nr:hypothetical protein [Saprospiraceae bacterium]
MIAMKDFMTWFPRILVMAFALFISVFALDAFSENNSIWESVTGFMIHLIPTMITLLLLMVAWNRRIFGGLLFVVWGLVFTIQFQTLRSPMLFLMFSIPLLFAGFLFIFSNAYLTRSGRA